MVYAKKKGLKYLLIAPVGAIFIIGIYSLAPEYFAIITDKTGSIVYRLLGIISKVEMITSNPFGAGEVALAKSLELTPEANSTLTMLYWGVVGGVQSIVLLLILLVHWSLSILKLSRVKDGFLCLLACGTLASLMQQSFYGTYFEYYFLSMMAVVTASARSYRRSLKSSGVA
jgi:4-amino-4-deoxy-L-arabinose transferase-like glycosyltransferase